MSTESLQLNLIPSKNLSCIVTQSEHNHRFLPAARNPGDGSGAVRLVDNAALLDAAQLPNHFVAFCLLSVRRLDDEHPLLDKLQEVVNVLDADDLGVETIKPLETISRNIATSMSRQT